MLGCGFAHSSSRIDACMNDAEPDAIRRLKSFVFSVISLLRTRLESSQQSLRPLCRTKLNYL
jgi:hypothetical protein